MPLKQYFTTGYNQSRMKRNRIKIQAFRAMLEYLKTRTSLIKHRNVKIILPKGDKFRV